MESFLSQIYQVFLFLYILMSILILSPSTFQCPSLSVRFFFIRKAVVCVCVCVYVCVCVCVYIYTYIYICTYTHTHYPNLLHFQPTLSHLSTRKTNEMLTVRVQFTNSYGEKRQQLCCQTLAEFQPARKCATKGRK